MATYVVEDIVLRFGYTPELADQVSIADERFYATTDLISIDISASDYLEYLSQAYESPFDTISVSDITEQAVGTIVIDTITTWDIFEALDAYLDVFDTITVSEDLASWITILTFDEILVGDEQYSSIYGLYFDTVTTQDIVEIYTPALIVEDTVGTSDWGYYYTEGQTYGSFCWGHDTNVTEANILNLSSGSGTGQLESSGDPERVGLALGQSWTLDTVYTGILDSARIEINKYDPASYAGITVKYRTGITQVQCESASWIPWDGTKFSSAGFVQIMFEAT